MMLWFIIKFCNSFVLIFLDIKIRKKWMEFFAPCMYDTKHFRLIDFYSHYFFSEKYSQICSRCFKIDMENESKTYEIHMQEFKLWILLYHFIHYTFELTSQFQWNSKFLTCISVLFLFWFSPFDKSQKIIFVKSVIKAQ